MYMFPQTPHRKNLQHKLNVRPGRSSLVAAVEEADLRPSPWNVETRASYAPGRVREPRRALEQAAVPRGDRAAGRRSGEPSPPALSKLFLPWLIRIFLLWLIRLLLYLL